MYYALFIVILQTMLKIRLQRVGRKHEPSFRLVLTDSKNSSKSGRFKEILGSYDPRKAVEAFKSDRIKHWLSVGVGITPTVNNLLVRNKIVIGKKINVSNPLKGKASVASGEVAVEESVAPEITQEVAPVVEVPQEVHADVIVEEFPAPATDEGVEKKTE